MSASSLLVGVLNYHSGINILKKINYCLKFFKGKLKLKSITIIVITNIDKLLSVKILYCLQNITFIISKLRILSWTVLPTKKTWVLSLKMVLLFKMLHLLYDEDLVWSSQITPEIEDVCHYRNTGNEDYSKWRSIKIGELNLHNH